LLWLGLLKTNITGDQRLSQNLVQVNLSAQSASVRCSICRNILQIMRKYFPNYAQIFCKLFTNVLKILHKYFANYAQISFEGRKLSGGEKGVEKGIRFLRIGEGSMCSPISLTFWRYTKAIIWHKKKVNFRISYLVFSSTGRVTSSGKFDCVCSFCTSSKFFSNCISLKQLLANNS